MHRAACDRFPRPPPKRSARECLEADANVTTDTEASADVELTTDLHFERGEPDREQVGMVPSLIYVQAVCNIHTVSMYVNEASYTNADPTRSLGGQFEIVFRDASVLGGNSRPLVRARFGVGLTADNRSASSETEIRSRLSTAETISERSASSTNGSASQSNFSITRSHDIGRVGEPSKSDCSRDAVRPSRRTTSTRAAVRSGYAAVRSGAGLTSTRDSRSWTSARRTRSVSNCSGPT